MAKTLVLAEKPSVGKELARVLGCRRGGEGCPVSYTHLDVYKRQSLLRPMFLSLLV